MTLIAVACGGDGGGDSTGAASPGSGTTSSKALKASELVPSLADLGFTQNPAEKAPNTGSLDLVFAVYERTSAPRAQARVEVRVYPDEAAAKGDFEAQAGGWKSPPPGLFGGDPANVDGPALPGMDQAKAYIATNRDPQGFRVWTDVYRIGRVIVVAHVLAQNEADVTPVRTAIGERIRSEAR